MTTIHNVENVPDDFIDDPHFESGLQTKMLSALAGSVRIYVNIDYVKPGAKSVKYHSHSLQEEFFLILKGHGVLRLEDKIIQIKQGDFFSKPAGRNIAHQFINSGEEVLEILDCGTKDDNDLVFYPDENVILSKKLGLAFDKSDSLSNWTSDPTDS